jgi:SCY1-like protein 2
MSGKTKNMSTPVSADIKDYELFDVEIKYGLLQVSEGLAFLHNDVKMLHRNLCPENIILTKKGVWKLFGFEFFAPALNPGDTPLKFPFFNVINHTTDFPSILLPNLDYLAPEYYDKSDESDSKAEQTVGLSADMYSLGAMTFTLYNQGKCLLPTENKVSELNASRVKKVHQITNNSDFELRCIPEDSRYHIRLLLSMDKMFRPDAIAFSKLNIFEDVQVRTLQYIDSSFQWDNLEKANFYKGLPEILASFPLRVQINRILPALAKEFINPDMVPFILPNYFLVIERMEDDEFVQVCLPQLEAVFRMQEPVQISMLLLQKVELILSKCKKNSEVVRNQILPMICRCFEYEAVQIQELCLQTVPTVVTLIEASLVKNSILPRIKKLCIHSTSLFIKVNCLLCIGKIIEHLDKWLVIDEIILFLPEVNSKEPAVLMAIIGIYQLAFTHPKLGLTKEVLCSKAIPHLMPLLIENGLTVPQFESILNLIRNMVSKVETEHKIKLEQLNSIKQQSMSVISYKATTDKPELGRTILTSSTTRNSHSSLLNDLDDASSSIPKIAPSPAPLALCSSPTLTTSSTAVLLPGSQTNAKKLQSVQPKDLTSSLVSTNINALSPSSQLTASALSINLNESFGAALRIGTANNQPVKPNYDPFVDVSPINSSSSFGSMLAIEAKPATKSNFSAFDNIPVAGLMKPAATANASSFKKSLIQLQANSNNSFATNLSGTSAPSPSYCSYSKTSQQFAQLDKSELDEFLN